jgi:hypothetical protein
MCQLDEILQDVTHHFPYNSFAPVLDLAGIITPAGLGGNCIEQVRVLGERIRRDTRYDVSYLVDGRHHALIAAWGDDAFYLDPYLLHDASIQLPATRGSTSVAAFPHIAGQPGIITVHRSGTSLRVTKQLASPNTAGYYLTHEFSFLLRDPLNAVMANRPDIALHAEVTTLSVRAFTMDLQLLSYVYAIPKRETYILDPSFARHASGTDGFEALLPVILRSVGQTREDFLEYVACGIATYWRRLEGRRIDYIYPNAITGGIIHAAND